MTGTTEWYEWWGFFFGDGIANPLLNQNQAFLFNAQELILVSDVHIHSFGNQTVTGMVGGSETGPMYIVETGGFVLGLSLAVLFWLSIRFLSHQQPGF